MPNLLQVVRNQCKKLRSNFFAYSFGLSITQVKKNVSSMSTETTIPKNYFYAFLEEENFSEKAKLFLVKQAQATTGKGVLLIDDTLLVKIFAHKIDDLTYDYSGVTKSVSKGLSAVVAGWTNGKIIIPLDFKFWVQEKYAPDKYKKKSTLAQELILQLKETIDFEYASLDGAYASYDMLSFFRFAPDQIQYANSE